ncbi:MAG: GNAT family N-acetyltransferase [Planctomycetota bacterium]
MGAAHNEAIKQVGILSDGVIELRPYTREMVGALVEVYHECKTEFNRFLPWANETEEQALAFLVSSERVHAEGAGINFSIHLLEEDGRFIGGIGLKDVDPFTPAGELGYWIRTPYTGRGFATRAVAVLMRYCEEEIGLKRLTVKAADTNPASLRVIEKSGFTREGFHPRAELCHGVWHDVVSYGLLLGEA